MSHKKQKFVSLGRNKAQGINSRGQRQTKAGRIVPFPVTIKDPMSCKGIAKNILHRGYVQVCDVDGNWWLTDCY